VNRELADSGKHAGEGLEDTFDVIRGVHVRGVEARDHRIQPGALLRWQRAIRHRDVGVGEGVVVERRVGLQVITRREVTGVRVRPRLLQRDAEQGGAGDARAHEAQEVANIRALLDVIRQVEVRIVELGVARSGD